MLIMFLILALMAPGDVFVIAYTPPYVLPSRFTRGTLHHLLTNDHLAAARAGNYYVNTTPSIFRQPVNHSDPTGVAFDQRFWVDYSAWDGGDEAILYIPGEGPGRSSPDGYIGIYGHRRHMLLFSLENRYYGESLPASLTDTMKLKKYLGVDIAIDDLRSFQIYVEEKLIGKKLRWLIVGGSYAGALSIWFKVKYPTAALAVWSSSGVVEPRLNFYAYDGHVKKEISPDCANAVDAVQLLFSNLWENESSRVAFLDRFSIPRYFDKAGISYMLADAVAAAVQYGKKWQMCDMLVPQNKTDPLGQFFTMIERMYGPEFVSDCSYSTTCLSNASFSDQWGPAGYAWVYQVCSELGYFQVGYHKSLRLGDVSTDYFIHQCRSVFGNSTFPDVFEFNAKWGGKRPVAGNVVALQGSDDPWSELGITKSLRPNFQAFVAECEGCGHCGDLALPLPTDPPSLREQREQLTRYLDIWMSSERVSYIIVLGGNFTDVAVTHIEGLLKALQSDLHDFFDQSASLYLQNIDRINHKLTAVVDVYMNDMNKMDINSALMNLRNSSMWLSRARKVFALWGIQGGVVVISLGESESPANSKCWEIVANVNALLSTVVLLFSVATILVVVAQWCFKREKVHGRNP